MLKVFTLFDKKGEGYTPPFTATTVGNAERQVKSIVAHKESDLGKYPEDFSLWQIGDFDETVGLLKPYERPQIVCEVVALQETNN